MSSYFRDFQDMIYIPKTRDYFNEVINSYNNGNLRSSTVMLYTLVVCDLLYKLMELRDIYNDKAATDILKNVEKTRNNKNISKTKWEKDIVERIHDNTALLEDDTYINILHLFDHRNLCAHPVLNSDYVLFTPNKETVSSHIRNMCEGLFIKPPFFISAITEKILEEMKQKKELYIDDETSLKRMLQTKYFSRMTREKFLSVFKCIWKLIYITDNDECNNNLVINNKVVEIMLEEQQDFLLENVRVNSNHYIVAFESECYDRDRLILGLCCRINGLFANLSEQLKIELEKRWKTFDDRISCSQWFKFSSFHEYFSSINDELNKSNSTTKLDPFIFRETKKYFFREGREKEWYDFSINYFSKSGSFDDSNELFDQFVLPILDSINIEQLKKLIQAVVSNYQIYGRKASRSDNTKIYEATHHRLKLDEKPYDKSNFEYTNKELDEFLDGVV